MKTLKYLIILSLVIPFGSCGKIEQQDPVPIVEFTSFSVFDTTDILGNRVKGGKLKFYFEDGDGDLGLQAPENGVTDSTNLFLTLYRKIDGTMNLAPDNDPLKPSPYRIPFMDREGINKMLKGTISVTFLYLFYTNTDTIQYDFFIKDRGNNESNISTTNEIVVSVNGVY